jgi:hypothetical protein
MLMMRILWNYSGILLRRSIISLTTKGKERMSNETLFPTIFFLIVGFSLGDPED